MASYGFVETMTETLRSRAVDLRNLFLPFANSESHRGSIFDNACLPRARSVQQIGEERLVGLSGEESRQLAFHKISQHFAELTVVFDAMKHERAEQHLSPCVVGPLLFSSARKPPFCD